MLYLCWFKEESHIKEQAMYILLLFDRITNQMSNSLLHMVNS